MPCAYVFFFFLVMLICCWFVENAELFVFVGNAGVLLFVAVLVEGGMRQSAPHIAAFCPRRRQKWPRLAPSPLPPSRALAPAQREHAVRVWWFFSVMLIYAVGLLKKRTCCECE